MILIVSNSLQEFSRMIGPYFHLDLEYYIKYNIIKMHQKIHRLVNPQRQRIMSKPI